MRHPRRMIPIVLAGAMAALAQAACANMPPLKLPEPLNPATATATETPTATPSPTPTPTPTPMPIEVVDQGQRDLRNGDWDSASLTFQQVLTDPGADGDARAAAQIGLAHASLQRGDFTSARAILDTFLGEFPTHPRTAQAYFLRGDARLGLSDWSGAIGDYQHYLTLRSGLVDSYVYERIGDAYLAQNQSDAALQAYDQATQADRPLVSMLQLREKIASIDRSLGNVDGAIAQYQAILDVSQNNYYRATIEFYMGQAWLEAGNTDKGYAQLDHVFMSYPNSYEALSALRALLDAGYTVAPEDQGPWQYERGIVNFNQGQYDIAIQAFVNYLAATDFGAVDPAVHLYIARAYRQLGNLNSALSELQGLIGRYNPASSPAWGDAWLEMADIYGSLGQTDQAFSTLDQFVSSSGSLPQAPDAIVQAAQLAESAGDLQKAVSYYRDLAAMFPTDARAPEGYFKIGLDAYQQQDYATAQDLFTSVAQSPAADQPASGYLWLARTLQAAGQSDAAQQALQQAVAANPTGYYGLRAADILAGRAPFAPPASFALPTSPDEGRDEAEQWIVTTFSLSQTPPLAADLRGDIAADPRMVQGRELWDLGVISDAKQDFEAVRKAFYDDPLASYQLAIYFREIGLYSSSILAAARVETLANVSPLDAPQFLTRLRYPTYFSDLVISAAQQYGIDPLYVFALIEQESLFEGFATSTASAQGLMQIWPPTGEDIAARLSWPNYRASDLQRPFVNVAFGTWLLSDEFKRFNGDPIAVLAAYNAGSGNALNWENQSGGDPDLYVELVSLSEPQSYIQSIYRHYDVYRALYGSTRP